MNIRMPLGLKLFKIAITIGHRWAMRYTSQQLNGLDAFFKCTRQQIV